MLGRTYKLNKMISKRETYKSVKIFQKSWQFHNFLPLNVTIVLENFQKNSMFFFSKLANVCHKKSLNIAH
jgi:hypothetical protein